MEVDLVEHCGAVKQDGNFVHSLVMTDIASGWTECIAMQVRNQLLVVEGFAKASQDRPFGISGIDTDNGSEFVNEIVFMYCQKMGYEQTRSRPYRKNDQAWVEQKKRFSGKAPRGLWQAFGSSSLYHIATAIRRFSFVRQFPSTIVQAQIETP